MKTLIIVILLFIFASLALALGQLLRERGRGEGTLRALTWRITLSVVLFAGLMAGTWLGWHPGHAPSQPVHEQEQH